MRRLIATQTFPYRAGALMLKPGDRFMPVSAEDARLLIGWGKAMEDIVPSVPVKTVEPPPVTPPIRRGRGRAREGV